jgi:GNAT superfamily N-acetyltransferase
MTANRSDIAMRFDFRPMTTDDIAAGLALCEIAGWNQRERDWRLFLHRNPSGNCVAVHDGKVVGTAATLDYGPFAWISMVLVDPAVRGRGLGTALLEQTLEILRDSACARLDATPLGEPVYRKLGFEDEYALERWERPAGPVNSATPAEPLVEVAPLIHLDQSAFGADREWLLGWLHDGAPSLAWQGRSGYVLGREGRKFTHIGPLVCENAGEAQALIAAALAAAGRDAVIDIPAAKARVVEALGFRRQRPLLRMRRGGPAPPLDERIFAIAGPELG